MPAHGRAAEEGRGGHNGSQAGHSARGANSSAQGNAHWGQTHGEEHQETIDIVERSREWRDEDRRGGLSWLGNIFWLLACGGFGVALVYYLIGALFMCSVILSPFGAQLFKLGSLALFPFGRNIVNVIADEESGMMLPSDAGCFEPCCCVGSATDEHGRPVRGRGCCSCCGCCGYCNCFGRGLLFLASLVWLPIGLALALVHLGLGIALCITVLGIPFGLQHFKLARLALCPFGKLDDNGLHPVETIVQTIRREPVFEALPVSEDETGHATQTYAEPLLGQVVSQTSQARASGASRAEASHYSSENAASAPPPLPPRK